MNNAKVYIVMGVSASGKTTIAKLLSKKLNLHFIEADDFHSVANKEKMKNGIPLTDEDRLPWLQALHTEIYSKLQQGITTVLACSALKKSYRNILANGIEEATVFIYLKGSYDVIYERIKNRKNHYMPASLLKSQFNDLEEPEEAITVNVNQTPEETIAAIITKLALHYN